MISVILVDPDPDFVQEIKWALKENSTIGICASTHDLSHVEALLEEHKPTVLFYGPGWQEKEIISFAQKTAKRFPEISQLLSAHEVSSKLVQSAIEAKIKDVLAIPISPKQIVSSINHAHELSRAWSKTCSDASQKTKKESEESEHLGNVITVFSTKGGVGKTVVATNLAVLLAQSNQAKVILLDLDLQFGDVGLMLKLRPERTIYDCLPFADGLDVEVLEGLLTPHDSGIKALLAPLEPELADLITPSGLEKIIHVLRKCADYIVVDTPASFNDAVLTVLDQTAQTYLITTMDIPSTKNIKLCLQTLTSLGYPSDQLRLVINRTESNVGLEQAEIEKALGMKSLISIPTDRNVPLSINRGVPVTLDSPKAAASKRLKNLARFVLTPPKENSHKENLESKQPVQKKG